MSNLEDLLQTEDIPDHPKPEVIVLKKGVMSNKWIGECSICMGINFIETSRFPDADTIHGPCSSCDTKERVEFFRINSVVGQSLKDEVLKNG